MNRDQFLRALRSYCKANKLPKPDFDQRKGKGSHGSLAIGDRFTTVPDGELKRFTLEKMLKDLGLPKDAV